MPMPSMHACCLKNPVQYVLSQMRVSCKLNSIRAVIHKLIVEFHGYFFHFISFFLWLYLNYNFFFRVSVKNNIVFISKNVGSRKNNIQRIYFWIYRNKYAAVFYLIISHENRNTNMFYKFC